MADAILRIKTVMDVNDVVSNVGAIQKSLSKLKLPDNLKNNLSKNIGAFYKEYEKYQKKLADGINTQGDYNQVEKSLNRLKALYSDIGKDAAKAVKIDPNALFDLNEGKFKGIVDKIEQTIKQLSNIKIDTKAFSDPLKEIENLTKNKKITSDDGILNRMMGHINTGNIAEAKKEYQALAKEIEKASPRKVFDKNGQEINAPGTFNTAHYEQLQAVLTRLGAAFAKASQDTKPLEEELNRLQQELAETVTAASKDLTGQVGDYNKQAAGVEKVTDSLKRMHAEEFNFNRQTQDIDRQIQSYFGLSQMIRKVGEIARDAFQTVKELDAAMVETAVVTNFDVGDMWDMLPTYTEHANQLGATIKDVYEAATLYFQQGLNLSQSMGLADETLKMARIGGLQAAEATNMMTAALRGFNMEINQTSAQKINDVYSELAAITAADTKEIGSAMERTASIANSAGMQFETTSAFLAQMIETTREAPENLGTAMKTIIARFQEMKQDPTKLVDAEGEALDVNKIDTALKTVGIDLTNAKGEFRELDQVFLDISEKWDSMTQGQQRYIATVAAGSRQQSRFIAMMQNHERVMELVDAANNSAGAGQKQYEKTLEGLSAKLNKLKNAWDQFTMGLMNNEIIKKGVDALTQAFTLINKLIGWLGKIPPKPFEGITKSALTLATTLGMLQLGKKGARGLIMGAAASYKGGEGGFFKNFSEGFSGTGAKFASYGQQAAAEFNKGWNAGIKSGGGFFGSLGKNTTALKETFIGSIGKLGKQGLTEGIIKYPELEASIRSAFAKASAGVDASVFGNQDGNEYINGVIESVKKGDITSGKALGEKIYNDTGGKVDISNQKIDGKGLKAASLSAKEFDGAITRAGSSLQMFGAVLQSTPLAPFGSMLSAVGMACTAFGGVFSVTSAAISAGWTVISEATVINLKTITTAFKAAMAEIPVIGWILLAISAAITAAMAIWKGVDAIWDSQAEKLDRASDAAAKASEAFDLAKQETSELSDAIERIRESDKAFDNLVAGTAEFNEQLVTTNQQITELLGKYPMLSEYITTDKNGVMHVSEAGLEAVKDYQKALQAEASAMNIIQTADLNALEHQQKARELDKKADSRKTDSDDAKKYRKEADLLREQAKVEVEMGRQNGIRTVLAQKDLRNAEAISAIYADMYADRQKLAQEEVSSLGKHDILQRYANYHDYTYNKSTKKMKDREGNEVDYKDDYKSGVIKDEVIEQTVMLSFEDDAGSLNSVLNKLDAEFNDKLKGTFEDSEHFISDILSSNIETNTDILEKVLESPKELEEVANKLTKDEIASILGISKDTVAEETDKYRKEVVDLLTSKAEKVAEAQFEGYSELAAMMAQTEYGTFKKSMSDGAQNQIRGEIQQLTAKQANLLSTVGQTLRDNVGPDAMKQFIGQATDIYFSENVEQISALDDILENINWDSPTSRLAGYNEMIGSTEESVRNLGNSMKSSVDEVNLLGNAFDEFATGDWEQLAENADNFKNSLGQIDAAGIIAASNESKTLKMLLDTDEVSASAVATALQGIEDGKYSIGAVDTTVLKLLSSLNQLKDVALESHNIIENFDPGIDYNEANDFATESADKVKEFMKNNQWGNEQLQSYIKFFAGQEKWNQTLQKYHGDFKKTTQELDNYVTAFSNGITPVYNKLASGKGINGADIAKNIQQAVDDKKIDSALAEKFNQVEIYKDKNGFIQFDFGDLTTKEFEQYLQIAGDMGDEAAKLLMEHLANYAETEMSELSANDLRAYLTSDEFKNNLGTDANGNILEGAKGFTNSQLSVIESAEGGKEALKELAVELGYLANGSTATADEVDAAVEKMKEDSFKLTNENGNPLAGGKGLVRAYDERYGTGKGRIDALFGIEKLQDELGRLDFSKLTSQWKAIGFNEDQIKESAWATYQKAQQTGEDVSINGVKLKDNIKDINEFWEEVSKGPEKQQWHDVGTAIAEGIISYIDGKDNGGKNKDDKSRTPKPQTPKETQPQQRREHHYTRNDRDGSYHKRDSGAQQQALKNQSIGTDWLAKLFKSSGSKDTDSSGSAKGSDKSTGTSKDFSTKLDGSAKSLSDAAASLKKSATAISNAIEKLSGGGAKGSKGSNSGGNNGKPTTIPTLNIPKGDNQKTITVKDEQVVSAIKRVKTLNNLVEKGGTYTLDVSGVKKLKNAAQSAKTLSKNTGDKTISVKTGKADTSSLKAAKQQIKNTSAKMRIEANTKPALNEAEAARKKIDNKKATIDVSINQTGSKTVTIVVKKKGKTVGTTTEGDLQWKGKNNKIASHPLPSFGSVAKGARYGQVGPKGKGGLTLTGEKGFEIAWIPSESKSMILGADGPQMLNLPSDAVVYTHEQSKKIIKQKAIPAGSHSGMSDTGDDSSSSGGGGGGNGNGNKNKHNPKAKTVWLKLDTPGKVSVWWDNQVRKVEATQRAIDKLVKKVEKGIKDIGMTLKKFGEQNYVKDYLNKIKEAIKLNNQSLDKANSELENLDFDKDKSKTSISYTQKYKKKGGKKTKKKTKKAKVSLSDYIIYDEEHDTYIIDQEAIDAVAAKNKSKAKAIKEAANEKIDDKLSKRNTAEDNIEQAQEALDKFAEDLYNAFFAWKNELTEIWNITQKIAASEGRISRVKEYQDLLNKQLSTGLQTATDAFNTQTFEAFVLNIQESVEKIKEQMNLLEGQNDLLEEQKNVVERAISSSDEQAILASVQEKLNPRLALDQAAEDKLAEKAVIEEQIEDKRDERQKHKDKITDLNKKLKKVKNKARKKELKAKIKEQEKIVSDINAEINTYKTQIETVMQEYTQILQDAEEVLNETEKIGYEKYAENIKKQLEAQAYAHKYMTVTQRGDGTVDVQFNAELFESDKENGLLNEDTGNAIQEYVKQIVEESKTLNDNYQQLTSDIISLYDELSTLQDQWVDYADQLWDMSEAQTKVEIENFKKLSDSISNALKKLLDEVKRKLDERRRQEDNAKTERDISQKQQRLAALRADTAGGHQTEIAQLEKEIAEAQENYGRSLEDQLLDKMQQQADLAAEQRERQIELQESIVDGVNNAAQVNKWMNDPMAYREEIFEAFKTANDYNEKPEALQEELLRKFEVMFNGLVNNKAQQIVVKEAIGDLESTVEAIANSLDLMQQKNTIQSIAQLRDWGLTDEQIHNNVGLGIERFIDEGIKDVQSLKNAGFSAQELKGQNYTAKDLLEGGYTVKDLKEGGYTAEELRAEDFTYDELKDTYSLEDLAAAHFEDAENALAEQQEREARLKDYNDTLAKAAENKKLSADELNNLIALGEPIEKGVASVLKDLANRDEFTWKNVLKAAKNAKLSKLRLSLTFDSKEYKKAFNAVYGKDQYAKSRKKAKAKKLHAYAQGGIADFTGPAWLDGTKSKPELVLDAQDTKNFLALRDVLGKTMSTLNSTNGNYNNAVYEININVDHISSDYDVDRMAERIKKDIIRDAGYRNVTQVRNFR